jgi:hypothetical protein
MLQVIRLYIYDLTTYGVAQPSAPVSPRPEVPYVSTLLLTLLAGAEAPLVSGAVVWIRNEIRRRRFLVSLGSGRRRGARA